MQSFAGCRGRDEVAVSKSCTLLESLYLLWDYCWSLQWEGWLFRWRDTSFYQSIF